MEEKKISIELTEDEACAFVDSCDKARAIFERIADISKLATDSEGKQYNSDHIVNLASVMYMLGELVQFRFTNAKLENELTRVRLKVKESLMEANRQEIEAMEKARKEQ